MDESTERSEVSESRIARNVVLIIVGTAFVLAFPFSMSILWFPGEMLRAYVLVSAVVGGVISLIYVFVESEKSRAKSLEDSGQEH